MSVGDVIEVRGHLYEVVGFHDDEPILRRTGETP